MTTSRGDGVSLRIKDRRLALIYEGIGDNAETGEEYTVQMEVEMPRLQATFADIATHNRDMSDAQLWDELLEKMSRIAAKQGAR